MQILFQVPVTETIHIIIETELLKDGTQASSQFTIPIPSQGPKTYFFSPHVYNNYSYYSP